MRTYIELICQNCQKPFKALPKEIRRRGRRFCSYRCCIHLRNYTPTETVEKRFWAQVTKTDSCWLWMGKPDADGYGRMYAYGIQMKAHQLSWKLHNGPIPKGISVCHNCFPNPDNRKCVNPNHLFLGTTKDNIVDASIKGTLSRGEKHPGAKVDDNGVVEIRRLASLVKSFESIGRTFGITGSTARKIVFRTLRKHIP